MGNCSNGIQPRRGKEMYRSSFLRIKNNIVNGQKLQNLNDVKISEGLFVIESNEDPNDFYLKELPLGSSNKVFRVKHKQTNVLRAMKVINKEKDKINEVDQNRLISAIKILKQLDHQNIMKVYEYFNTPTDIVIISELCTGGALLKKLMRVRRFKETVVANIMSQLLSVVECCHQKNILHGHLKMEDILIESKEEANQEYFNIKIIDFGIDEIVHKTNIFNDKNPNYVRYVAPEILNKKTYDSKCDLWSLGVIMYILLTGEQPFKGNYNEIVNGIKNNDIIFTEDQKKYISQSAQDLMLHLLIKAPIERFSARQALDHEWIKTNGRNRTSTISEEEIRNVINNLKSFSASNKLQQATLAYIVHYLIDNSKDVKLIKDIFRLFDDNGDGLISKDELKKGLCRVMTELEAETQANKIISIVDADGNGYIECEEFIRASIDKRKILTTENLQLVFSYFDLDKNGYITPDEIKEVLDQEGFFDDKVWTKLIKEIDINGDGEISFIEFKKMMNLLFKEEI